MWEYEDLEEIVQEDDSFQNGTNTVELDRVAVDNTPDDTFTIDQAVDAIGFGKFQIKLSLMTGLAWMADAMEMMILSILSPALHCDWHLESWQQALITTFVFVGMMSSSGFWGKFCDKYGRKLELIFCSVITFYFGLMSSFAPALIWMWILRGLVGVGIGGAPQSVTLYAEFLPSATRAKCVVFVEIFWAIGTCFEVILALIVMPTLGWRWLLALSSMPLLIFTIACVWLPESARFDLARGKPERALATLERIAKDNGKPMPLGRLVGAPRPHEIHKRGQMRDLLIPEFRKTTILLWIIWFANAFSYYGIVLLTTELFGSKTGEACTTQYTEPACSLECKELSTKDYVDLLWTTLAEFPGLFITFFIIDPLGRKKTMAIEFIIFAVATFLVGICVHRTLLVVFLFIGRAFVSGAFQAAYVYTPEVYPTVIRAVGLGSCSTFARIGAILTPFVAQVLIRYSIYATIGLYGGVCIIAAVASMYLPIETKGREMRDSH